MSHKLKTSIYLPMRPGLNFNFPFSLQVKSPDLKHFCTELSEICSVLKKMSWEQQVFIIPVEILWCCKKWYSNHEPLPRAIFSRKEPALSFTSPKEESFSLTWVDQWIWAHIQPLAHTKYWMMPKAGVLW